jgi:hypothetical protein
VMRVRMTYPDPRNEYTGFQAKKKRRKNWNNIFFFRTQKWNLSMTMTTSRRPWWVVCSEGIAIGRGTLYLRNYVVYKWWKSIFILLFTAVIRIRFLTCEFGIQDE